ncbi:hypothetical protein CY35_03G064500 [Sphagnum magellanicum]|nr:hypothetical protein CY35_03G064500 [Sphagnum magellanicum]
MCTKHASLMYSTITSTAWNLPHSHEQALKESCILLLPWILQRPSESPIFLNGQHHETKFRILKGFQSFDWNKGLGLVSTIKDRANEIYKKVEDLKSIRGRSQDAILAACLYIACRQEDKPRTFKEICSVANGASKKEIGRATKFIVKQLEEEMGMSMEMGTIHAGDFLRRFCSHLGMSNTAVRAATETVKRSEMLDIRKSPISVAAAAIYMISQLSDDKKNLKDISGVAGVAEVTIRNSYKDLYPHAAKLIPDWFAKDVDLKNLCTP